MRTLNLIIDEIEPLKVAIRKRLNELEGSISVLNRDIQSADKMNSPIPLKWKRERDRLRNESGHLVRILTQI